MQSRAYTHRLTTLCQEPRGEARRGRRRRARREPAEWPLASQTKRAKPSGMKMTLDIDAKKVEEAMAEYHVDTKTEIIDLALRELLRKKAVARVLAAAGTMPNLPTNEEIEGSYEKNHVLNPPRR